MSGFRSSAVVAATLTILVSAGAMARSGTAGPLVPSPDQTLALKFRPFLYFDSRERWRPVEIDGFLREAGHRVCDRAQPARCVPLRSASQLGPGARYLDLRGTRPEGSDARAPDLATCARSARDLYDCDGGGRSAIYAHVRRTPTRIAIDYWWFARYNAFLVDLHEGDWEGVTVVVGPAEQRVTEVHFAAHGDVWRYDPGVARFTGHHVRVYVARGSHASYPRPCRREVCHQTGRSLPEARSDGLRHWVNDADSRCLLRCVRLLTDESWNRWDGRWGAPRRGAFAAPLTPAFQPRYRRPFSARVSHRHGF